MTLYQVVHCLTWVVENSSSISTHKFLTTYLGISNQILMLKLLGAQLRAMLHVASAWLQCGYQLVQD